MGPRAPHTRRGERLARTATAGTSWEDQHRAGEHDQHQTAECRICVAQAYITVSDPPYDRAYAPRRSA